MSYILDALKKSDAERMRGLVPGIHAQPTVPNAHKGDRHWLPEPFILILTGIGLTLLCLIVWWWIDSGTSQRALLAPATIPIVEKASTPPEVVSATATVVPPIEETIQPANLRPVKPMAREKRLAPKTLVPDVTPRQSPTAFVNKIPSVNELSENIRLSLPKLAVSGATYAENPAYRMLIINGQVFHEGEKPLPDLKLEQIKPNEAVLNFKGTRYFVAY